MAEVIGFTGRFRIVSRKRIFRSPIRVVQFEVGDLFHSQYELDGLEYKTIWVDATDNSLKYWKVNLNDWVITKK